MKCPNCGLPVADDANFCGHCGKSITASQTNVAGSPKAAGIPEDVAIPSVRGNNPDTNFYMSPPLDVVEEQQLWDEYPSMRTAIPAILMWIIGGIAVIVGLQFVPFPLIAVGQVAVAAVVGIIILAVIIRYFIRYHSTKYRLTTQRIFITHGLLNKRTDEVELEKYKDIFVNHGFWDKIVGCGDIEMITSDITNPTIRIIDVSDPFGKKEDIRSAAKDRKSLLGINRREEL